MASGRCKCLALWAPWLSKLQHFAENTTKAAETTTWGLSVAGPHRQILLPHRVLCISRVQQRARWEGARAVSVLFRLSAGNQVSAGTPAVGLPAAHTRAGRRIWAREASRRRENAQRAPCTPSVCLRFRLCAAPTLPARGCAAFHSSFCLRLLAGMQAMWCGPAASCPLCLGPSGSPSLGPHARALLQLCNPMLADHERGGEAAQRGAADRVHDPQG